MRLGHRRGRCPGLARGGIFLTLADASVRHEPAAAAGGTTRVSQKATDSHGHGARTAPRAATPPRGPPVTKPPAHRQSALDRPTTSTSGVIVAFALSPRQLSDWRCSWLFEGQNASQRRRPSQPFPLAARRQDKRAGRPRLQTQPFKDDEPAKQGHNGASTATAGWTRPGIAHMPIDDAKELIAAAGLPDAGRRADGPWPRLIARAASGRRTPTRAAVAPQANPLRTRADGPNEHVILVATGGTTAAGAADGTGVWPHCVPPAQSVRAAVPLQPQPGPSSQSRAPCRRSASISGWADPAAGPHVPGRERRACGSASYFGRRPVVLAFVYYECPMLCTQVLNGADRAR